MKGYLKQTIIRCLKKKTGENILQVIPWQRKNRLEEE